jgi:hypothetical protein
MTRPSRSGAFAVISWHAPSTDVMRAAVLALALCAALVSPAFGFYLPGVAPQDYARVRAPSPPRDPRSFIFRGANGPATLLIDFPRTRSCSPPRAFSA